MNYKEKILEFLEKIENDDIIFLRQIYTIIKRHVEKKEGQERPSS